MTNPAHQAADRIAKALEAGPTLAKPIPVSELTAKVSYDSETGQFTWRVPLKRAGLQAGATNARGYVYLRHEGTTYAAHRLAMAISVGERRDCVVDHINGNPDDNRLVNLRYADKRANRLNVFTRAKNNTSGFNGVYWEERRAMWVARCKTPDGRDIKKRFRLKESAISAAKAMNKGDF